MLQELGVQQQRRKQDKVRIQPTHDRFHQRTSVGRSLTPDSVSSHTQRSPRLKAQDSAAKSRTKNSSRRATSPLNAALTRTLGRGVLAPLSSASSIKETPPESPNKRSNRRTRSRATAPVLYGLRLLILGVGIGAIAGTLLSVLDPTSRITAGTSQTQVQRTQQKQTLNEGIHTSALNLSQEIMPLKTAVVTLAAKNAGLVPGFFFMDLDTGAYIDVNGASTFASASMIKFPVLVAFFQDVDAGKIRLDENLTLQKEMIGGGSGEMQYQPLGTKFTALETVNKMITISDNTATNMLIAHMGGAAALNQRFLSWGLTTTAILNPLPDLSGTNTTSPRDLANLMALVNQGDLMSLRSRDRLLDIMRRTVTDTLLPRGLGKGATIAHKTGDIGSLVGDVGLIDMPSGKRYVAAAMVKRPYNDGRAQELIRQVSREAYLQFNKSAGTAPLIPRPER